MRSIIVIVFSWVAFTSLNAQITDNRRSLLDHHDPDVVYLEEIVDLPIKLSVIKEAPVYSDKNGQRRLGYLKADQTIELEAMTGKAYKVRGKGTRNGIAGWVPPWAFSHPEENFVEKLKQFYTRQVTVNQIIANAGVAIGMTPLEVSRSRGQPTKTTVRSTAQGQEGTWEFIDFEEIKHYNTSIDKFTGQIFRHYSHTTREERGRVIVEFKDSMVSAIQESEDTSVSNIRTVRPPIFFRR